MNTTLDTARVRLPEIIGDIASLVETETYSRDRSGLDNGLECVRKLLTLRLGAPAEEQLEDDGVLGPTLKVTYPGSGPGRVLILAHYDTVWPTGTLAGWPLTEGTDPSGRATLSGPGIFDMKTGLVQGIWALKLLTDAGNPRPTVTFLFNGDEEIGSIASRAAIEKAAQDADAVLVLEATAGGAVKTGRKGVGIFTVTATGVEAHAGLDPAAGASAIHALAEFVTAAVGVADLSRGTSINVGLIEGGSGSNVAAGHAKATIDIRVETAAEMERVDRELDAIRISDDRVSLQIEHFWNRPPMTADPGDPLLALVRGAALALGHELEDASVGGASDANFVAALGVPVLCGMGAVGSGAHARGEYIHPDAVPLYTALTADALSRLVNGLPPLHG
ncbi:M20 family metallopeptidase [Arthrobacter citreus]|uniref:M20 family metallopeptidase n=1 Tax=Arthrobacter citreus TaxID=1670 RepID=A0ABZ2ZXD1_9MICC